MAAISTPGMARAARAWVSVMLPPPMRPMWKVMLRSESMIRGHEVFVGGFGGFGGGDGRADQDAIAKGGAGIAGEGGIQLLFAMAEAFLREGVDLASLKSTFSLRARSGVMRSMMRKPGAPRNTKCVCSSSRTFLSKVTQSASTSSSPCCEPLFAETTERWTMAPILGASSGLMASELFQKSMPLTLS